MAATAVRCTRCGAALAIGREGASLCPACLISSVLDRPDTDDSPVETASSETFPYEAITIMARSDRSATYLAHAVGSARPIALTLALPAVNGELVRRRAAMWRRALLRVRHIHLARVLAVGTSAAGAVYVASEYVAARPLTTLVRAPRATQVAIDLVLDQVRDALASLHAAGLAHMRVDAEHVRVTSDEPPQAMLVGVGLALIFEGVEPAIAIDLDALERLGREARAAHGTRGGR